MGELICFVLLCSCWWYFQKGM